MVLGALREKRMNVAVGGCLKHKVASRRERKREELWAVPGFRESEGGCETNSRGELRVKWRRLWALGAGRT